MKKFLEVLIKWGPTISTAIISFISAYLLNRKSISANVKAKSRIKWIEEVRTVTVNFLSSCNELINYVNFRPNGDATPDEKMEYENLMTRTIKYAIELKLFFSYKPSDYNNKREKHGLIISEMECSSSNQGMNVKMIYLFDEISEIASKALSQLDDLERADVYDYFKKLPPSYSKDVSYAVSRYLKIEWDRAKKGK